MKDMAALKEKYERALSVIHQLESQVKRLEQKARSHVCPGQKTI